LRHWAPCTPITKRSITAPRPAGLRQGHGSGWPARYPKDDEAQIHYCAGAQHLGAARPTRTYANPAQGARPILEEIAKAPAPQHPRRGALPESISTTIRRSPDKRPSKLPGAMPRSRPTRPHALHMPSHIFNARRLLAGNRSISNMASGTFRQGQRGDFPRTAARHGLPGSMPICSSGQDKKAGDVVEGDERGHRLHRGPAIAGPYARGCFNRQRYAVERRRLGKAGGCPLKSAPSPPAAGPGDHLFLPAPGGAPPAQAIRRPPRPTSPKLAENARQARPGQGRPTGPGRSIIQRQIAGPLGCSTRRASRDEALSAMNAAADAEGQDREASRDTGLCPSRRANSMPACCSRAAMAKESARRPSKRR